jgi:hypothetical protein
MSADHTPAPAPAPQRPDCLFHKLANTRPTLSNAEADALVKANPFTYVDRTWVTLWYDPAHMVTSDCGRMTAYRAITATGDLLWYVAPDGDAPVYHAQCADPFEAMEHAAASVGIRSDVARRWAHIERLAGELRNGTLEFDVTFEDARHSPVCPTGFRTVMASLGLFGARTMSGRVAAMLMRVEPSVGFIIHTAWIRSLMTAPTGRHILRAKPPVGYEGIC